MDKSVASRPGWEMMSGFPPCTCATKPEQLPSELAPGEPRACNHLYVKKSADRDRFQISLSPGTSVGSPPTSSEKEKPQGVCVLRGGPVSIVIYPMPPGAANDTSPTTQSGPAFASLADERAADDMGVLLMGGQSRANSSSSSRRRIIRSSGRSSPLRRSRSSADARNRKACNPGSVTLKMPSRAYEVYIKLEKVLKASSAKSPNELAGRTDMVESTEANGRTGNRIGCYKHTISSLISSRLAEMNREARMLQELDSDRKGAHRPYRPPPTKANAGPTRCLYDGYSKLPKRQPFQLSFH